MKSVLVLRGASAATHPMLKRGALDIGRTLLGFMVSFWIAALLSADLKVGVNPFIHWVITVPVLGLLIPYWILQRKIAITWVVPATCLFVVTILVHASLGVDAAEGIQQSIKIFIILVFGTSLFATFPWMGRLGTKAIVFSTVLNAILLVLGQFGAEQLASLMAPGRWGTFLNYPGSLWRVGMASLVYAAIRLFYSQKQKMTWFVVTLCSVYTIYMDGSRTAMVVGLVALFVLHVSSLRLGLTRDRLRVVPIIVVSIAAIGALFVLMRSGEGIRAIDGFRSIIYAVLSRNVTALEAVDLTRMTMIRAAWDAIRSRPFLGSGLGTTTVLTPVGPMHVHMTYLQLWADLGLFGLIAYLWVTLGWLVHFPRARRQLVSLANEEQAALYYNALFLLVFFALVGFFHPFSSEWSEWILFLIAHGLYWELLHPTFRTLSE